MLSYYRGFYAATLKMTVQLSIRCGTLTHFEQATESKVAASLLTAIVSTLVAYPFDVALCKMASDMSKKPSLYHKNKGLQTMDTNLA